ncbi:PucR family transcriptional regulator [Streptomyces caniferus]|uniref:PucR family transcriptional regulator n=1 Tax=Streptomyces caniferus TaxID=285557 RepID=A0ABZ1VPY7_9ACTN|nr:helix-turn-helix domain-containing protein [Streptomyces caniferus]
MPPPLPPPSTPPVPLADLLARTDLGLRQIAGPREGVAIHWVHTSEMADPVPYLLGGEMLLTAGVHLAEVRRDAGQEAAAALDAYLDGYAARTVAAGAAALGFGIAPVHDTVPRALVAACDRHGLPLVEVPAGTPFTAVESAVWQAVTQARHRELTRLSEAQRALAAAAARPDPAAAVLRALARHVHGWTALLAPDGAEHGSAGPRPTPAVRAAADRLAQVVGASGPSSATDTLPGSSLSAYALTGRARGGRARALVVAADPHDPPAHAIAGVAAVLLSLITGPAAADQGRVPAGHSAALVRLLLGARPAEVAPLLGAPLWTVVHAERRRDTTESAASLAAALGTPLVAPDAGAGRATAAGTSPAAGTTPSPEAEAAPGAVPALRALVPADQQITARPGWTLGVSGPVPVAELPAADRHAASALRRALAGHAALVRHRTPGPHSITSLVAPTDARQHAQALLAPLADSPPLLSTLHNWLSLHGSWDRTATALGIHRNTVRQRITRIAGLLDTDLDDPDVRMELWFALRSLDRGAAAD